MELDEAIKSLGEVQGTFPKQRRLTVDNHTLESQCTKGNMTGVGVGDWGTHFSQMLIY